MAPGERGQVMLVAATWARDRAREKAGTLWGSTSTTSRPAGEARSGDVGVVQVPQTGARADTSSGDLKVARRPAPTRPPRQQPAAATRRLVVGKHDTPATINDVGR